MSKKNLARIDYANGWRLLLPKEGNAAMLFLEWLALFNATTLPVHKIINDREGNALEIRMVCTNDIIHQAKQYINSNL